MELLQLQSDQGPCLDCVRSGSPVNIIDLAVATAADRWPVFAAAVAESTAFRSVHALPLRLRREAIGALNLFHRHPGPRLCGCPKTLRIPVGLAVPRRLSSSMISRWR
jgi:hypothetical protein